jgi:hypothetical protein
MTLTPIQAVRLEIGDNLTDYQILADSDVQYFLDKYSQIVSKASLDCAKSILFILARMVRSKAGELETWQTDYFTSYIAALKLYVSNPSFSVAIQGAMPYAGGISKKDALANIADIDSVPVTPENGIPHDFYAAGLYGGQPDVFSPSLPFRTDPFSSGY